MAPDVDTRKGCPWCLLAWIQVVGASVAASRHAPEQFYPIFWIVCHLSANPFPCACRNLRIRTMGTPCRVGTQASDLHRHWVYKGENGVGSALILRLRQNQTLQQGYLPVQTPVVGRGCLPFTPTPPVQDARNSGPRYRAPQHSDRAGPDRRCRAPSVVLSWADPVCCFTSVG